MPLISEIDMLVEGLTDTDGNKIPVPDFEKWDVRDGERRITEIHKSGTINGEFVHVVKTFTNYRIEDRRQVVDESEWSEV